MRSIVKEGDQTMLVVGSRKPALPTVANINALQRLANDMSRGAFRPPRGVFKFATHEEANTWTMTQIKRGRLVEPPPSTT